MAGEILHKFESTVPDEGVSTEVGPDEWNDSLKVDGGADGQAMVRRTSADDGWELIYLGAPLAFINATQVANSGTGETSLHSFTLPADFFNANKRAVRVTMWGSFAANGNTKTLKFKNGANVITLNPTTTAPNGVRFKAVITLIRTGSDAQRLLYEMVIDTAYEIVGIDTATEDDGATMVLLSTGQSGTASSDILLDQTTVEYLN
jgi:hypothetical protein